MAFLSRSIRVLSAVLSLLSTGSATAQDLSFAGLREILLRDRPTTIAATLQAIAKQYPSYLAHHTLAYHSISLHGSSYDNPRAIVFGNTADFVLSFNGDPLQRGFGALEMMQFSPLGGYAFREIAFLQEPKNAVELIDADEIELRTDAVVISKPNPGICTSCHDKTNPRPIWEPAAIWPGIYGSANDRLYRFLLESEQRPVRRRISSAPGVRGGDPERDGFNRYLANRRSHPRYGTLPLPRGIERVAFERTSSPSLRHRPNLTLSTLLSIQAAKLIVRDAGDGPDGPGHLVLVAATECVRRNPGDPVPAALQGLVDGAGIWRNRFSHDIAGMTKRDTDRMQEYFGGNIRLPLADAAAEAAAQPYLLAAALDRIGLNIRNYAFNINRVNSFQDGANGLFALAPMLRETLQQQLRLDHPPDCGEIYRALK
jgi:hypothetical protein